MEISLEHYKDLVSAGRRFDHDKNDDGIVLPRKAILHLIRGRAEMAHHRNLWRSYGLTGNRVYKPRLDRRILDDPNEPLDENEYCGIIRHQLLACCNKTAPFYLLANTFEGWRLVLQIVQNWLYKRWIRPYRSEIDLGQFIGKLINPIGNFGIDSPVDVVERISKLNSRVCQEVRRARGSLDGMHEEGWEQNEARFLHVKASFEAVAVVLDSRDFRLDPDDTGNMRVCIVRTGVESGLSAPVSFGSLDTSTREGRSNLLNHTCEDGESRQLVYTTLHEAFEYLMDLEERETVALGPIPNPKETISGKTRSRNCLSRDYQSVARAYGWEHRWRDMGKLLPTSTWVDTKVFPEWIGAGYESMVKFLEPLEAMERRFIMRYVRRRPHYRFTVRHYEDDSDNQLVSSLWPRPDFW